MKQLTFYRNFFLKNNNSVKNTFHEYMYANYNNYRNKKKTSTDNYYSVNYLTANFSYITTQSFFFSSCGGDGAGVGCALC